METLFEAQVLVRRIAGAPGSVGDRIERAARKLPLSINRVKDIWYADPRIKVSADELLALRKAARVADDRRSLKERRALQARIRELEALVAKLSRAGGRG